jgi:hypothetical protein
MKIIAALGAAATTSALALGGAAFAQPPHSHPTHPVASHKCAARQVAYRAAGTLVSWSATKAVDGRYSGAITVHVTHANHHARSAKGSDVTYTLSGAKVVLGRRADPPVAGDRLSMIGKISDVATKCTDQTAAGTVTVHTVIVHAPAPAA